MMGPVQFRQLRPVDYVARNFTTGLQKCINIKRIKAGQSKGYRKHACCITLPDYKIPSCRRIIIVEKTSPEMNQNLENLLSKRLAHFLKVFQSEHYCKDFRSVTICVELHANVSCDLAVRAGSNEQKYKLALMCSKWSEVKRSNQTDCRRMLLLQLLMRSSWRHLRHE